MFMRLADSKTILIIRKEIIMKRIITFMMALALVLSLSVTAFADGGGSITITNATTTEVYSVYKIFDAVYEGDKVAYTLNDSTLEGYMFGSAAVEYADIGEAVDFFEFDDTTKVVTLRDSADKTKLFKYLGNLVKDGKVAVAATTTAADTAVQFTGLDTGYYVIDRGTGTANAVTITTTKPHADVVDKNILPTPPDKTADKTTANVGDTVNWTVTFTSTNYDDGKKVTYYKIKDTLTPADWAAINIDSIVIEVGGTTLVKGTDWTLESDPAKKDGFEINIPWVDAAGEFKYATTAEVVIPYSATVLEGAVSEDPAVETNKNTADLDWSAETEDDDDKDETDTEVYNLGFTKVDGTTRAGLAGADFGLYSDSACTNPVYVKPTGTEGVYIVDSDGTSNSVTTPASGQVVIQGLAAGTYYLKETKAPAGYNLLTDAIEVEVKAEAGDEITIGAYTYYVNNAEQNIENNSGVELPSTGGKGTIMMITFGAMVAMAFAVLLITQKKMSIYHD